METEEPLSPKENRTKMTNFIRTGKQLQSRGWEDPQGQQSFYRLPGPISPASQIVKAAIPWEGEIEPPFLKG